MGQVWEWEEMFEIHEAEPETVRYPNERDEYLTRAYVDGRNAARDGKSRTDITDLYACDPLAAVNWEIGYDDWIADSQLE